MNWRLALLRFWNFWPPFVGCGIRIQKVTPDYREMRIVLKKRWWNSNAVGTAFGGGMFAMTDAFYMVMLLRNLGSDYIVWDKSATIEYLKPGKTHLYAHFRLSTEDLDHIRAQVAQNQKMDWHRTVEIQDASGQLIARVTKVLYIRSKSRT